MTDDGPGIPRVRPVLELFRPNVIAFWATTYNIDLALFNEFLLGRLGDPPINVAILADSQRLAATLERIPPEKASQVAQVNRRWLLRGAQLGGGRFHPKSYLAVTRTQATLLVGSGNLSTTGLDEGREVFAEFVSGTDAGDDAIAAWRSWMRRVVRRIDDTRLAERFDDLESKFPGSTRPRVGRDRSLLDNLDRPIADQLVEAISAPIGGPIGELLVTAPFFDKQALALGHLIERLAPRKISLYTTSTTSVDGSSLAKVLADSDATVDLFAYEPDRFTHAKLVGVIAGSEAWVLSGSANVSRAALTLSASEGNVELAVLTSATPEQVRTLFVPPDTTTRQLALEALMSLTHESDPESDALPIRLLHATTHAGGRVEVRCEPTPQPGSQLDDLAVRRDLVSVAGKTLTDGPLIGRLVCVVASDGAVLSNRVVVDDPDALDAVLRARERPTDDRPPELLSGDLDTPVGKALAWLHRNLVMDVSERASPGAGSGGVGSRESDSVTDDDLWERLEREKLGRDPRANTYDRVLGRPAGQGANEVILELLEAMRDRVPAPDHLARASEPMSILALLRECAGQEEADAAEADGENVAKKRWKVETRIRVRARNVLRRWAAAQTDPRLLWIDSLAPAGNFAMVASMFAQLWRDIGADPDRCELRAADLDELWLDWMRPFVGTGRGDGWLDQLDLTDPAVGNRLPRDLPETIAGLCCLAVTHKPRGTVIAWQPVLNAARGDGLLEPSEETARFVSDVTHAPLSRGQIEEDLLRCIEFIDDDLWCERTRKELDLAGLQLQAVTDVKGVSLRLFVKGVHAPLRDPRIPQLIVAARRYRRCDGVAIFSDDVGWRLVVKTGSRAAYLPRVNGDTTHESQRIAAEWIERLASTGGILADLFVRGQVA